MTAKDVSSTGGTIYTPETNDVNKLKKQTHSILDRYSVISKETKGFGSLSYKISNFLAQFKENSLFKDVVKERSRSYSKENKMHVKKYVLPIIKENLHMGKIEKKEDYLNQTEHLIEKLNNKLDKDHNKIFASLSRDVVRNYKKYNIKNRIEAKKLSQNLKSIIKEKNTIDTKHDRIINEIKKFSTVINQNDQNAKAPTRTYAKFAQFRKDLKETLNSEVHFYRKETVKINLEVKSERNKAQTLTTSFKSKDLQALMQMESSDNTKAEFIDLLKELHRNPSSISRMPIEQLDEDLKELLESIGDSGPGNTFHILVDLLKRFRTGKGDNSHYSDAFQLELFIKEHLAEEIEEIGEILVTGREDSGEVARFLNSAFDYENILRENAALILNKAQKEGLDPTLMTKLQSVLPALIVEVVAEHAAAKFGVNPEILERELHKKEPNYQAYSLAPQIFPRFKSFVKSYAANSSKKDALDSATIMKNFGLSKTQIEGLHLLTKVMRDEASMPTGAEPSSGEVLSEADVKSLKEFIDSCPNNPVLNRALNQMVKNEQIPFGISSQAVNFLWTFSFKGKDAEETVRAMDRLEPLLDKIHNNGTPTEEEKITLSQLGLIDRMASLEKILNAFEQHNIKTPDLSRFISNSKRAKDLIQTVNARAAPHIAKHYQTGDTTAVLGNEESAFKNRPLSTEQKLTVKLISEAVHLGKVVVTPEKKVKKLEVMGGYVHKELNSLAEVCYSETYRLEFGKYLEQRGNIDPFALDLLKLKYGNRWKEIVKDKFKSGYVSLEKLGKDLFDGYENTKEQRMKAGGADFAPIAHKTLSKTSAEALWHSIIEEGKLPQDLKKESEEFSIICSQFDLIADIFAFHEFNRFISLHIEELHNELQQGKISLLNEETGEPDPDKVALKEKLTRDHASRDQEIDKKINDKKLVRVPFSEHERLEFVNPARNLKLKKKTGAYGKVERPDFAKKLIKGA